MSTSLALLSLKREIFIDNLLVRVHFIIEMSRPALRNGSLNSLFQVAVYLPSSASLPSSLRCDAPPPPCVAPPPPPCDSPPPSCVPPSLSSDSTAIDSGVFCVCWE